MNEAQIQFLVSKGKINNAQADFLRKKSGIQSEPQQVKQTAQPQEMGVLEQATRMVFPRLSETSPEAPLLQRIGRSFTDLASLPGRVGATYGGMALSPLTGQEVDLRSLPQQIGQTGSQQSIVGDIVRSPETIPSFMVPVAKIPQGISALNKARILAQQGAKIGSVTGSIGQVENIGEGRGISPVEFGKEVGFGAVLNPAVGGVMSALAKTPEAVTKGLAAVSQKFSIPGEFKKIKPALEAFGWGKGKDAQKIIENAGEEKTLEIGKKIFDTAEKISRGETESKIIKEALNNMGEINISPVVKALKEQLYPIGKTPLPDAKKEVNSIIQKEIDRLTTVLKNGEEVGKIANRNFTAKDYFELRRDLDKIIPWKNDPYDVSGDLAKRLNKARKVMKESLIDAAYYSGNDDYINAIKKWSDNIDIAESVFASPGGQLFKTNPQSALSNLFGSGKLELRKAIKDLEKASGQDLLEPAKNNYYSRLLGMESGDVAPAAITRVTTGLGVLPAGGVLQALMTGGNIGLPLATGATAMALGSPRVAAGLAATAKGLKAPTERGVTRALRGSQKVTPITQQAANREENR